MANPIQCVVPREIADKVEQPLRKAFADLHDVEVVVDRRAGERRTASRRRREPAEIFKGERRRVRSTDGVRVAERRASTVHAGPLQLPRRVRAHADRIRFLERVPRTPQQLEDAAAARLVIRAQRGDAEAFPALYACYLDRVYNYLRVALKDRHEAEDIAQDVFLRILCALPTFELRRDKPFRLLLFRITRNRVIDHMRKQGVVDAEPPDRMLLRRELASSEATDALVHELEDAELAILLRRLPPSQRQAVALRYMLDFGTEEIAEIMQISPQAVRNLQHRALRFLRERFLELDRRPLRVTRAAMLRRLRGAPVLLQRRLALTPTFAAGSMPWSRARAW
jgi:RNA polymerase sigma-70 factor (ECF subfamily)